MKYLLSKQAEKSRDDVKGYVCYGCSGTCYGSCSGSCEGGCTGSCSTFCGKLAW